MVTRIFCLLVLTLSGLDKAYAQANAHQELVVQFTPGQMVQLIAPVNGDDEQSKAYRQQYYQEAIPLAQSFGFKNHIQLNVSDTYIGKFENLSFVLSSWPSNEKFDAFNESEEWPALKALREQAWQELMLFNSAIDQATELRFKEDKFYTVLLAWTRPDSESKYDDYLQAIEPLFAQIGAKFMLKLRQPTMESHASELGAPYRINIVEWSSKDGFAQLQALDEYEKLIPLRNSGLRGVEFHQVTPVFTK